jgi:hypothetical protein
LSGGRTLWGPGDQPPPGPSSSDKIKSGFTGTLARLRQIQAANWGGLSIRAQQHEASCVVDPVERPYKAPNGRLEERESAIERATAMLPAVHRLASGSQNRDVEIDADHPRATDDPEQ